LNDQKSNLDASGEGQKTVARNGSYLPLSAAVVREQLKKLD
jgi:hypothetical protein